MLLPLEFSSGSTVVTILVEEELYEKGEEIVIQGSTSNLTNDSPVKISVIDPNGDLYKIIDLATIFGKYSYKFIIEESKAVTGIYTVKAVHAGGFAQTSFQLGRTLNQVDVVIQYGAGLENSKKSFGPKVLSVTRGTTVVWANKDIISHSITSGVPDRADYGVLFDSGFPFISPKGTFEHKFDFSDIFPYFCTIHPWMIGKIIVGDPSEDPSIAINALTKLTDFDTGIQLELQGQSNLFFYSSLCQ